MQSQHSILLGQRRESEVSIISSTSQVNSSGEESKFGVEPEDSLALAKHIKENCQSLKYAPTTDKAPIV